MSNKAIIRIQKLKSHVAIHRSLKHAFREQDTPNADPSRINTNTHIGSQNSKQARSAISERLPLKTRKNAVLAVEYLITASPEVMKSKSKTEQDKYFSDSLDFLRKKHGAENVVYAGIHRDETTPHMYAYVVPNDPKGKLNCRHFFGEKNALSDLQTDFSEQVGLKNGLERGLKGSKARHTSIQTYYTRVNKAIGEKIDLKPPSKSSLFESKENYGKRVLEEALKTIKPQMDSLYAKASEYESMKKSLESASDKLSRVMKKNLENINFSKKIPSITLEIIPILEQAKANNQSVILGKSKNQTEEMINDVYKNLAPHFGVRVFNSEVEKEQFEKLKGKDTGFER